MLSWNISDFTGANHQVIAVILVSLVSFIFSLSIKSKQNGWNTKEGRKFLDRFDAQFDSLWINHIKLTSAFVQ